MFWHEAMMNNAVDMRFCGDRGSQPWYCWDMKEGVWVCLGWRAACPASLRYLPLALKERFA